MAKRTKSSDTKPNEQKKKDKESVGGLIARIDRIEKKLNLLSTLGKTMPVIILSSGAILGSLIYLAMNTTIPSSTTELPQTGDETEVTSDFVLLYPENYSSTSLPDEVIGLSIKGFYDDLTKVEFFAQKSGEDIIEIGEGEKAAESGEYKTSWTSATAGRYYIWAKITRESGVEYKSASVIVDIE